MKKSFLFAVSFGEGIVRMVMGVLSQEPAGGSFISDPYQGMKKGIKRIISVPHGGVKRHVDRISAAIRATSVAHEPSRGTATHRCAVARDRIIIAGEMPAPHG